MDVAIVLAEAEETVLREGSFHRGRAALTHFVARKAGVNQAANAAATAGARTADIARGLDATHRTAVALQARLHRINQRVANLTRQTPQRPDKTEPPYRPPVAQPYRTAMDLVFAGCEPAVGGARDGTATDDEPQRAGTGEDQLLLSAATSVRDSCNEAARSGWCRYCWVPGASCICTDVGHCIDAAAAATTTAAAAAAAAAAALDDENLNPEASPTSTPGVDPAIHWVIISHPSEFLRSTSSAKIAAQVLAALPGCSSELLVYGCPQHNERLDEILADDTAPAGILFPAPTVTNAKMAGAAPVTCALSVDTFVSRDGVVPCMRAPPSADTLCNPTAVAPTDGDGGAGAAPCSTEISTDGSSATVKRRTLVVPDGSWECARALVRELQSRLARLGKAPAAAPFVPLDDAKVKQHHSPLIEALKAGQGQGRISTLEACALFLREAGRSASAAALLGALGPLVDFVDATKPTTGASRPSVSVDRKTLSQWTAALQAAAKENPPVIAAGLRLCVVCGENMATPVRMQQHVRGKRHCAAVAMAHFAAVAPAGGVRGAAQSRPTLEVAKLMLETQSSAPLAAALPEPPDVAAAALRRRLAALPKGERALLAEQPPQVAAPLPDRLRSRHTLRFDPGDIDLRGAVGALLQRLPSIGSFGPTPKPASNDDTLEVDRVSLSGGRGGAGQLRLERFQVTTDVFRSFKERQVLYAAVSTDLALLGAYERLVTEVCCPYLKRLLLHRPHMDDGTTPLPEHGVGDGVETVFHYQHPPTLRLQPGPSKEHGRKHRDLEYGHQVRTATQLDSAPPFWRASRETPSLPCATTAVSALPTSWSQISDHPHLYCCPPPTPHLVIFVQAGEVNFWMPLTAYAATQTTLMVETAPGTADFQPLAESHGDIAMFHGVLCHHYAPPNQSCSTRVSLDFRVGVGGHFDPNWELKGARGQHGRRTLRM